MADIIVKFKNLHPQNNPLYHLKVWGPFILMDVLSGGSSLLLKAKILMIGNMVYNCHVYKCDVKRVIYWLVLLLYHLRLVLYLLNDNMGTTCDRGPSG